MLDLVLEAADAVEAHGLEVDCGALTIVGAFHPSQQNTFTGRLTPDMLDAVFLRARRLIPVN